MEKSLDDVLFYHVAGDAKFRRDGSVRKAMKTAQNEHLLTTIRQFSDGARHQNDALSPVNNTILRRRVVNDVESGILRYEENSLARSA